MTRITGATLTEAQSQVIRAAFLVHMGITAGSGPYYYAAFDADLTWGGNTYHHAPFTVQAMDERDDGTITAISLGFSLGQDDLASVFATRANYVRKALAVSLVLIDTTGAPMTDAAYSWSGFLTAAGSDQSDGHAQLAITGQDWLSLLEQTGRIRFDDVSQQARSAGDTFFSNMPGLQGQHLNWLGKSPPGNAPPASPALGTPTGNRTRRPR